MDALLATSLVTLLCCLAVSALIPPGVLADGALTPAVGYAATGCANHYCYLYDLPGMQCCLESIGHYHDSCDVATAMPDGQSVQSTGSAWRRLGKARPLTPPLTLRLPDSIPRCRRITLTPL